jgi:hypothetical protein
VKGRKPNVKRLAKGLSKDSNDAGHERGRTNPVGAKPRGNARRKVGDARELSPLARLVQLLGEEGIRFQMVGMAAAIVQGVPATTTDTDFWVDLPERQYIRLLNLVASLKGKALTQTVYVLQDGAMVNFIFKLTGLKSFRAEYKDSKEVMWNGLKIRVLPLERIYASKKASARDKDFAALPLIQRVIEATKKMRRKK